jgi:hypothetical protein
MTTEIKKTAAVTEEALGGGRLAPTMPTRRFAMTVQKFKSAIRRAEAMRRRAEPMMAEYWGGYIRGLRRAYHGENYGTAEAHASWLSAINSQNEARKQRGRGYADGLAFADANVAREAAMEAVEAKT